MTENSLESKEKATILLVDDDPLIIRMYQNRLNIDGYHVVTASNGEEALVQVRRTPPQLILMDMMMPKMNGIETLKEFKKDPATMNIPVIILTNLDDDPENIAKIKTMGAVNYLTKSNVSLTELSETIAQILKPSLPQ
jgi:CheY-like chemotaxis protein